MRVILLGDISGSRDGQDWPPRGSELDLPDDEAALLCAQRMARPVVTELVETEIATPLTTDVAEAVVPQAKRRSPRAAKR